MLARLAVALVTFVPTLAAARPITAGVNLGVAQSRTDGESGADPDSALGLFGRIGLTNRLSVQLELTRIKAEDASEVRSGTGLAVLELGSRSGFVPIVLAGVGVDKGTSARKGTHVEAGIGLEYRASGGFTIGVDVRMGERSIEQERDIRALDDKAVIALVDPLYVDADEGEYRSARLTLGVRF